MVNPESGGNEAGEWQMSVFDGEKSPSALCVSVRTIGDLTTAAKCLVDSIYFDGLDVLRCYEGRYRFSFKGRPAIDLAPGETLIIYPRILRPSSSA